MGLFSGLKGTKPIGGQRDVQAKPGRYLVRVDGFKRNKSAKPPFKEFVAFEFTVVKVLDENQGLAHTLGHEGVELCLNYGTGEQVFLPKVAAILKGCLNADPEDEDADAASGTDEPLKGLVVEMSASNKPYTDKKTKEAKVACNRSWHRSLPKSEVLAELDAAAMKRFFPNGVVENPYAPDEETSGQ